LWGLLFVFLLYFLAVVFDLKVLSSFLSAIRNYWIIAVVILFQPELRSILSKLNLSRELGSAFRRQEKTSLYSPIIDAVSSMSFRKTGALIVIENKRKLHEFVHSGEPVDASVSMRLILTIFNPKVFCTMAQSHQDERILAAKVVLPLSKKPDMPKIWNQTPGWIGLPSLAMPWRLLYRNKAARFQLLKL
jgi:diadenylate cyclase